ncbi:EAL domain-containing protein [Actinoplanes sp. NPDC051411]|uniref:putative bifunctional diguanylate cyclase/phosphodiesterase n=1 Tax=Actinoplanes sp. NPDC051411 TaxID=3155522 RepID=UPI003448A2D9
MLTRLSAIRGWIPAGGGLRDEDWAGRHRLLTLLLAATVPLLTAFGVFRDALATDWLVTILAVLGCVVAAVSLRPRRLPSTFVALGFTIACAGFVTMCHGLTEAHFSFFIAAAALALYRDWTPFGMFLLATTVQHAVFGATHGDHTYDHHSALVHPWVWALLHGGAVLLAAAFQVIGWRLTENEERRAEENLNESNAQLTVAFDETPVPMAMIAPDGVILRSNEAYRDWIGMSDGLPPGFTVADLPVTPLDADVEPLFDLLLRSAEPVTVTRRFRRETDGAIVWVEMHSTALHDRDGRLRLIFVHCLDVTSNRRHAEELRHQVRHDSLTGLLSRAAFEQDLAALLAEHPGPACLLYLDVDRFKTINDGSGHGAGDEVLRTLADRLSATVPGSSLIARLGGDEFVVALPGTLENGWDVADALVSAFAEPMDIGGSRMQVAVSIGLTVAQGAGQAEDAVLAADTAMYTAKRSGGNRVEAFSDEMRVSVRRRVVSEARLREALAGDPVETLPVWFQPVVSTADRRIVGAEALVRMRTPDGEILAPGHFIAAAEETGLVVPLGEHVLRIAVSHLMEWGDALGYVSVNVSPRQLGEPGFVPMLAELLAAHPGLDPSRLVLEITETALLSSSVDVQERLQMIKALGMRIALDDFGTGYSSLTWLQSVPADVVKLDRSFVAGLAADPRKSSIISAVLWLARSLGMSVTAEGVEDEADWNTLRSADCPAVQGYYISKPLPATEFATFLASFAGAAAA